MKVGDRVCYTSSIGPPKRRAGVIVWTCAEWAEVRYDDNGRTNSTALIALTLESTDADGHAADATD